MLDHHIQRTIVYTLAFADTLRFSELQPDGIESKLFTYHLKKVITAGYVIKHEDGTYALTASGRRIGKTVLKNDRFIDQAYSIILMAIRRPHDGAWLLYKRTAQPFIGKSGFMQALPRPDRHINDTAHEECLRKSGISADFTFITSGYFRVFSGDQLESFTHFTLLGCDTPTGELTQQDEFGEYYWYTDPDFNAADMLPTAATLSTAFTDRSSRFIEQDFHI